MGVTRRTTKDMSRGRSHLLSSHSFSTDSRNRKRLPYTTERKPAIFRPLQGAPPPAPLYLPDLGVSSFKSQANKFAHHSDSYFLYEQIVLNLTVFFPCLPHAIS